jgi:diguanylate cyclase (GGDEF)-like protein/PAS domain S-box-containing protein
MFITDASKVILRVNRMFTEITGYNAQEAVGQTPKLLSSGRHDAALYASIWDGIKLSGAWQGELWSRRKDGTVYPQNLGISSVKNDAGVTTHYVGAFTDITSYKAAEEQIQALAFSDQLTGLPNRMQLAVRVEQAMSADEQHQSQSAMLLVDLDNFKNINDTLGHEHGDLMLQGAATRLKGCVREGDTVARLGADEFVLLLTQLNSDPLEATKQTQIVASKILDALRQSYRVEQVEVSCSASIGISMFGQAHENVAEPLRRAELAMYQAKAAGRDTLRFFEPQMQALVNARIALEVALREAIRKQQFQLYYQPQWNDLGQITGVEALLRWQHPLRGPVSPAEFIALAEETGLILPIGNWVLQTACRQLANWAGQSALSALTIAVNVSARQFHQADFVDQVLEQLQSTGADPHRLKLELTETMLVSQVDEVIAKMKALKAHGVGFSLDDFGTGYSSLAYLKRLPLDQLKIDQGFVRDILTDADDAAIARMVIALADSMGLIVIAEGVETETQRELLASLGCHNYQGYLFSRPLPVAEFEALAQRS